MEQKYLDLKKQIARVYSSILSDMRVDRNDGYISPTNIRDIEESIVAFTRRVEEINNVFLKLTHSWIHRDFIEKEKEWLVDFSRGFVESLYTWLDFHKSELSNLEATISEIETDSESLDNMLLLRKKSLEIQMNQIQKINI